MWSTDRIGSNDDRTPTISRQHTKSSSSPSKSTKQLCEPVERRFSVWFRNGKHINLGRRSTASRIDRERREFVFLAPPNDIIISWQSSKQIQKIQQTHNAARSWITLEQIRELNICSTQSTPVEQKYVNFNRHWSVS